VAHALESRHMRVPVQQQIDALRRHGRWNVNEMDLETLNFECELEGPFGMLVAIAADKSKRPAERTQSFDDGRGADIPEVPDFITFGQQARQVCRQTVVSVSEHGDEHRRKDEG